jgi:GDSL-like Lipase/Acylhydrolase family
VSSLIGLAALAIAVWVDVQQVYRTFDIAAGLYIVLVLGVVVVTAIATIDYMRTKAQYKLPSLAVVVGFVCLVGGAVVVVLNLALLAYWRNNEPVAGPPIHELPAIPAIDGDYVSLGDSYSAGEGLRPFDAFTSTDPARLGDGCHRSRLAYSQLLRFTTPAPAVRFVACSGAVINDIFNAYPVPFGDDQALTVPPQVRSGEHEDVGLVTVTIGGNDAVFSRVVTHCFLHTDCLDSVFTPPDDQPARGVNLPDAQPLEDWAAEVLTDPGPTSVESKINAVYRRLKDTYPDEARIIAIGYPYLFPDSEAPFWNVTDCQTILRRFDHDERVQVRDLQDQLNQVLHDAAAASGIEFVSPAAGWDTHEPCGSSGEQYTNSIKPFLVSPLTGFEIGDGGTFHPNDAGQRELARLVTCYLIANPEAPTLVAGELPIGAIGNAVPDCLPNGD